MKMIKLLTNEIHNLRQELEDYKFYMNVIKDAVESSASNKAKVELIKDHIKYLEERRK